MILTRSGFDRLTSVGISVTKGKKLIPNFNITNTANALDMRAGMDSTYVDLLTATEKESYFRENRKYRVV